MAIFLSELQKEISQMDFSVPLGTAIIAYFGSTNGTAAWKVAHEVSQKAGRKAFYISDLPAGKLLNDTNFKNALKTVIGEKKHT